MKTCGDCKENKPADDFNRRGKGLQSACRQCQSIRRRNYYVANQEKEAAYNREWNQNNKPWLNPQHRERINKWRRDNKESRWSERHKRRGILKDAGSFSIDEWIELCNRFGNKCLSCGAPEITIDHVKPISQGGTNTIDNLQPLCQKCNSSKGSKTVDYRS